MSEGRDWSLPESHLLPDAVVAFVDAELSLGAHERAAAHLARCPGCAREVSAQRQARAAVRKADAPAMSAGFLASLCSIPDRTDVSTGPDGLAVDRDGQLVAVQRPELVAGLRDNGAIGSGSPLGSATPLGGSPNVLGGQDARRRTAQGAGVVVSGLVLSALALVATSTLDTGEQQQSTVPGKQPGVLRAQFGVPASPVPNSATSTSTAPAAAPMHGPR